MTYQYLASVRCNMLNRWHTLLRGASRSERLIVLIAAVIAVSWLGASFAAAIAGHGLAKQNQPALVHYAIGHHPYSQGYVPIQLLTYSFIHPLNLRLFINLLILYCVVPFALQMLSPTAFVRLYSLGCVCTGLVYLLVARLTGNQEPLVGAEGPLMATYGAFAALQPMHQVKLFGAIPTRLVWVTVLMFFLQLTNIRTQPAVTLGLIAGLIAGVLYGLIERLCRRYRWLR